jgi:hypothetical protein
MTTTNAVAAGIIMNIQNACPFVFPIDATSWCTVIVMAIKDGSGNLYWCGSLTTSRVVNQNDQFQFIAGAIDLTMD